MMLRLRHVEAQLNIIHAWQFVSRSVHCLKRRTFRLNQIWTFVGNFEVLRREAQPARQNIEFSSKTLNLRREAILSSFNRIHYNFKIVSRHILLDYTFQSSASTLRDVAMRRRWLD